MELRIRNFARLALALGLLAPSALAQKPPAPAPPPSNPPGTSNRTPGTLPSGTLPTQPRDELVLFIRGRIATDDGTPVPYDAVVERVCNSRVRQQVYASSHGDFSMDLGSTATSPVDASADPGRDAPLGRDRSNQYPGSGMSRFELSNCEVRAAVPGFRASIVSLIALRPDGGSLDVGNILVHRATKVKEMTVSARAYNVPKDARKAYERGLEAASKDKLTDARRFFEQAVAIHPKFTDAWFQLGGVLQKLAEREPARAAFVRATATDTRFLPPYISLAAMAFEEGNWTEAISFTDHVLDLDPLKNARITGYIVDMDPMDYAEAYFYNAAANYKLDKIEAAEKSARRAERLDVRSRFPQVHLLLATLVSRKGDRATAISELETYLRTVPHAKDEDQVRAWLARLQRLGAAPPAGEQSDPK